MENDMRGKWTLFYRHTNRKADTGWSEARTTASLSRQTLSNQQG